MLHAGGNEFTSFGMRHAINAGLEPRLRRPDPAVDSGLTAAHQLPGRTDRDRVGVDKAVHHERQRPDLAQKSWRT